MSTPSSTDIRDTLGAPTLLESAREAQRRAGNNGSEASGDGGGEGESGGEQQWKVKNLNPMSVNQDQGGERRERKVTQKDGVVEGEEGVEDVRGAASFLGKKLFGERFSGRVNEEGRQEEGTGSAGKDGNRQPSKKDGEQGADGKTGNAGKEGNGEDGSQDVAGKKGVRVTKTPKAAPVLTAENIASVVKATIESTRAAAAAEGNGKGSSHESSPDEFIKTLSPKDRKSFEIIGKMAEMNETYKDLPQQYIEFQKAKADYAKAWKEEHGEAVDWSDEEHANWVAENQPEFDEEDFVDARIELRADAVASKRMETLQEKLTETERRATEGTLRERMTETAKAEIGVFHEAFVPESEWDLTTAKGREAAEKEDPVIGGIAARWSELLETASQRLVKLYDGGGLWRANMDDQIDSYLATLAQHWEKALASTDPDSTMSKDGKAFATRAEFRKMTPEQQESHWIIGREEMLWMLPRDITERANKEKEEELDRLQAIAAARGWKFDRESLTTQKKRVRVNPDGIDEDGQRATRSAQIERGDGFDTGAPASTSGSKVSTQPNNRQEENKDFASLLSKRLFGRQAKDSQ